MAIRELLGGVACLRGVMDVLVGEPPLLLERDQQLAVLEDALSSARSGHGRLILLGGEAGVGKTRLVRRFFSVLKGVPVIMGVCDPVPTPQALGPFLDLAPQLGPAFEQLLDGSRSARDLFARVFSHLSALPSAVALVFEDVHWADQASLELITFLGRRVERLPLLATATFRDNEVEPDGPLALMLGDLATTPGVHRLTLGPLSREATARLADGSSADVEALYSRTGGNPFFIVEVLRDRNQKIPPSVRDAVLARVARLSAAARRALEAAAAIGARFDPGLLASVMEAAGTPAWSAREAINSGLLEIQGSSIIFRHELVQAAISDATPPELRQQLHATVLSELRRRLPGPDDYTTLASHAEAAGDDLAVLELAPRAAARAAALGAHREAASLYTKALERTREPARRAILLESRGVEFYASRQLDVAMADHLVAASLFRDLDDRLGEARNLIQFSYLKFATGDRAESETALRTATDLLEAAPPSRELALAYEARGRRLFVSNAPRSAAVWAERATVLADQFADTALSLEAGITAAAARLLAEDETAPARLRELREAARRESQAHGSAVDTAARAFFYLAFLPLLRRSYEGVDRALEEGKRYALENELEYWQSMMDGAQALRCLDAGRWEEATQQARAVLEMPNPAFRARLLAQIALARVCARTSQPGAADRLDEAMEIAHADPGLAGMIWPARVEAAWLVGDTARAEREVSAALVAMAGVGDPWQDGELAFWARVAGSRSVSRTIVAEPYRLALLGQWAAAADWWEDRGCPYEMAITLATADDPDAVRRGIAVLDQLGATPAAGYARQRLRELGVTSIPRGPRPSTSANPAGLTRREQEVLALVAMGLSNALIATRLFLSEKTVERHLQGIFRKLDVASRADAVQVARRAGALTEVQFDGPSSPN